jgi:hypothetical protein
VTPAAMLGADVRIDLVYVDVALLSHCDVQPARHKQQ